MLSENGPKVDPTETEVKIEAPVPHPHEGQFNNNVCIEVINVIKGYLIWLKLDTFYC